MSDAILDATKGSFKCFSKPLDVAMILLLTSVGVQKKSGKYLKFESEGKVGKVAKLSETVN